MKNREEYGSLNGVEKVAVMMLSLSEEQSAQLFSQMDEAEIREISQAMSNLGKVNSTVVDTMLVDFAEQLSSTGSIVGSFQSTERLLVKVLSKERVDTIMEDIRGPAGRTMWDKLGNVNEDVLANYLKNEYPQTIAVVLSRIRPEHASKVLTLLSDDIGMEVIMRMLRMESVQKEILDDIERTLRTEFMNNIARSARRDTYEVVADIFNSLDRASEAKFIEMVEVRNKDAADRIKSLMFTFEDLIKVDGVGIQKLLSTIDKSKLPLALKGGSETIKVLMFKNMSERASKMLKEEMNEMGMVKLRDVEEAQNNIILTAKDLMSRGEIVLSNPHEQNDKMIG